ncbi:MAG: sugar phosphate isomerase/epimerase [Chloroflexota bacterium]|nr:sugar phosphate isomerase/epimerase [Chloroflexota bacterium]
MRLALNGATIMRAPVEQDVEIAAACGYDALEIWAGKLADYTRTRPLGRLAEHMRAHGIVPWSINSIEDITQRDAAGRRDLLDELRRTVAAATTLGAPAIVVVPGAGHGAPRNAVVDDAVDVLRAMSDVAGDVALAFEFLGKPGCSAPTLDMVNEIVARVDRANVGMVIDVFHFYAGGSRIADLQRVPVEKLIVLHLNGCEDLPRERLTDAHRLYPGEGVIPAGAILGALRECGFDGVASVEIFRPQYWEQDPHEVAYTAYARAVQVLTAAGYTIERPGRAVWPAGRP